MAFSSPPFLFLFFSPFLCPLPKVWEPCWNDEKQALCHSWMASRSQGHGMPLPLMGTQRGRPFLFPSYIRPTMATNEDIYPNMGYWALPLTPVSTTLLTFISMVFLTPTSPLTMALATDTVRFPHCLLTLSLPTFSTPSTAQSSSLSTPFPLITIIHPYCPPTLTVLRYSTPPHLPPTLILLLPLHL